MFLACIDSFLPPFSAARESVRAPRTSTGSGTRVWLVRHGAVAPDLSGSAYGNADVPLSPEGEAQAAAVGASFRGHVLDSVHASPLERARRMGKAIAQAAGLELRIDERLAELDRGDWQGLERLEVQARWDRMAEDYWADPLHFRGHGGETEHELAERTWQAFSDAAHVGGSVVLATHHNVIRSILASALGVPVAASFALRQDLAHASLLVDGRGGWALAGCNLSCGRTGSAS